MIICNVKTLPAINANEREGGDLVRTGGKFLLCGGLGEDSVKEDQVQIAEKARIFQNKSERLNTYDIRKIALYENTRESGLPAVTDLPVFMDWSARKLNYIDIDDGIIYLLSNYIANINNPFYYDGYIWLISVVNPSNWLAYNRILRTSDLETIEQVRDQGEAGDLIPSWEQRILKVGDFFYCWGGYRGTFQKLNYDAVLRSTNLMDWELISNTPDIDVSSRNCMIVEKQGKAWIFGGSNLTETESNLKIFTTEDFVTFTEQYIDDPIDIWGGSACVKGNDIYITGGTIGGKVDIMGTNYNDKTLKISTWDEETQTPKKYDYVSVAGDRLDSLSVREYGSADYVGLILGSNRHIKKERLKSLILEPGTKLNFPSINSEENDIAESSEPVAWWKA